MTRSLQDLDYRLLYKFKSLYPFDESALDKGLADKGYQQAQMALQTEGGRFAVTGRGKLDKDGKSAASVFDSTKSHFSIQGNDFSMVNKLHEDFEDVIYHIDPDLLRDVAFMEINLQFRTRTKALPLKTIQRFADKETLNHWEKLFGAPVGLFSLRLARQDALDSQRNIRDVESFFEVKIEPMILNPTFYVVQIMYRDSHLSTVKGIAKDIALYVERLFEMLEGS